jgi:hypothetical protein
VVRGSRYVAGWVVVAALATSVAAGTLELVRGAVGGGTAVDALSQADVASAYGAAQQSSTAAPGSSSTAGPSAWRSSTKAPSTRPSHPLTSPSQPRAGGRTTTATAQPTSAPTHPASPPPSHSPSPTPSSITKLLSSPGGSVVAQCTGSGDNGSVYLVSWSPAQGYFVDSVHRGPSVEAEIEYDSDAQSVSVTIQCASSGPVQSVETGSGWGGGGDD